MHERERRQIILHRLAERGLVTVRELTEAMDASEATVRRDIVRLAELGLLRKVHGGAESLDEGPAHHPLAGQPFQVSRTMNVEKKRAIARQAVELCREGESIIINGGSTTYMMTEFLIDRRLQILTNSFAIAEQLLARSQNRIILPGGEIYREQNIILSPFGNDITQNHYAAKMFMGAQALGPMGVMEVDPLLIQAEQKLINQAEKLVVMVDSTKFRQRAGLILCPLERVQLVITDDDAPDSAVQMLEAAGVEVIVVPLERAASSAA